MVAASINPTLPNFNARLEVASAAFGAFQAQPRVTTKDESA
jgi:hypothetical protein